MYSELNDIPFDFSKFKFVRPENAEFKEYEVPFAFIRSNLRYTVSTYSPKPTDELHKFLHAAIAGDDLNHSKYYLQPKCFDLTSGISLRNVAMIVSIDIDYSPTLTPEGYPTAVTYDIDYFVYPNPEHEHEQWPQT